MPTTWLDSGQAHVALLSNPATRGAQTSTYYGAWGSGATAPAVAQTALVAENPETRVACTVSNPVADTVRYLFEVTATAARTVQEFSVNTATTGATAIIRGTLASATPVEAADRIEFTIDLKYKDVTEP